MTSPRYPWYLPLNPCCCNNTNPCDPCGNAQTDTQRWTDNIVYNGPALPCLDIDQWDTLTTVIQKIEVAICGITTTTTTTVT